MDFYPTILEIAGIDAMPDQQLDGRSLVQTLKGHKMKNRPLFWHYPHYGNQGGEPSAIIMKEDWKLIHYFEDDRAELYNVAVEIGEKSDLSKQYPDRLRKMLAELKTWQKAVGASFPTKNPKFDEAKQKSRLARLEKNGNPRREAQHANFMKPDFKPGKRWWDQPLIKD
jgi:arylsulfatase A-like enzyme